MKQRELEKQTDEQLKAKIKGSKVLFGIFIPIIAGLLYFSTKDYFEGGENEWSVFTIAICSLGGALIVWMELRVAQKELRRRGGE